MPRLLSPDDACIRVRVPTLAGEVTYSGRVIDVSSPSQVRALREAGYVLADVARSARSSGRVCQACDFRGYFTTCGRCGARCERHP